MFTPKEIDFTRVENIKTVIKLETKSQAKFARSIGMTPENLNRIIKLRHPLTEATAETICIHYPKYRKEWLLGYDPFMTEEEKTRSKDKGIRLGAPITVLDTALQNVCRAEGIKTPTLDNIPELMLLEAQLNDYAEMLMKNYIHRNDSHFWRTLDQALDTIERKLKGSTDTDTK